MKIFINLGSFKGDPSPPGFEVIEIDPQGDTPGVIKKAAWIFDGQTEFNFRPVEDPFGSTAQPDKKDWGNDVKLVDCFDFSKWLKQFNPSDYIILKMDIEGSEFPILEKMITDGTDSLVNELQIEWHDQKMTNPKAYALKKQYILEHLSCPVKEWL